MLPLAGGVVAGGVVAGGVVAGGVVDAGVVAGGVVLGGVVCLDFEGLAEAGRLAALDDFPEFAAPALPDAVPLPPTPAPGLPWAFLCPERDGLGVLALGAAWADGTAEATAELTGGEE